MKSNHAAAAFPKLQKLFTGNPMEKKEALKLFVLSGCNCEQVEASFSVSRESEVGSEWEEQHLTVAEMIREGFSQRLDCNIACIVHTRRSVLWPLLRAK